MSTGSTVRTQTHVDRTVEGTSEGEKMGTYYTATCVLLWLALGVLCILVHEDERIAPIDRQLHYITYAVIGLSLLAEWGGVILSGIPEMPVWAIRAVKCCDYILTPLAGGALTAQMRVKNRWGYALVGVLGANAVLQFVSLFTGWMVTVEGAVGYSHGPLYGVYMGVYVAVIILVIIQFLTYGKSFRRENRLSLWASSGMVVVGIVMQELFGAGVRTAYVGLTLGAALLYIHFTEFSLQRAGDRIRRQQRQITTDALTGTRSRHAYAQMLESFSQKEALPESLAVFSIDVNGLKQVNDELGHDAGDELLRGAANCILGTFAGYGSCYRIGGDEFIVIAYMDKKKAEDTLRRLSEETAAWGNGEIEGISLSTGYALASEHEGKSCEELVSISDGIMYKAKTEYYRHADHDRRQSPR